jgi:hypothetical protein
VGRGGVNLTHGTRCGVGELGVSESRRTHRSSHWRPPEAAQCSASVGTSSVRLWTPRIAPATRRCGAPIRAGVGRRLRQSSTSDYPAASDPASDALSGARQSPPRAKTRGGLCKRNSSNHPERVSPSRSPSEDSPACGDTRTAPQQATTRCHRPDRSQEDRRAGRDGRRTLRRWSHLRPDHVGRVRAR